jgi:cytochrome b pre-mRNA-processing protein 3
MHSAVSHEIKDPHRTLSLGSIAAWVLVAVTGVGAVFWSQTRASAELRAMPALERAALYARTLETLRTTCTQIQGSELLDYCRQQAEFVSRFPECDAACQGACQRLLPRPTK